MFSRLIVKCLPSNCTEAKLRSVFGQYGEITDCSLKYTKDGKFRKFAYVGFASEEDALQALKGLDGTHVGPARIKVEECKPFGDVAKPRAWSKYSKGSSAYKRAHPDENKPNLEKHGKETAQPAKTAKVDDDEKFQQFLKLHSESSTEPTAVTSRIVKNDELLEQLLEETTGDTLLSAFLCDLPSTIKQKNVKEWLSPVRIKAMKIVRNAENALGLVTLFNHGDLERVLARNGDFLGGFKVTVKKVPEIKNIDLQNPTFLGNRKAEAESLTGAILETGRLFVRNLPYSCTEDDLHFLFKKYGEMAEVRVIINKKTKQCKGFAFITYVFPENAVAAYSLLDGTIFKGRMLHILPGGEKKDSQEKNSQKNIFKSSFQKEKMAKLKENAGKTHSWNALFLGSSAVADTLAAKLNIEKGDLLSGEGDMSAGVRLALGETHLVRETREFLLSHGVCLDAFSRPAVKRSDKVIIVKNLPANVDVEELKRMFSRFGLINQLLMPPGGITAIVEMENTAEARKAFNALAYSRFRSQPLYLEWAPIDVYKKVSEETSEEVQISECTQSETANQKLSNVLSEEEKKLLRKSKKRRLLQFDNGKTEESVQKTEVEAKPCKQAKNTAGETCSDFEGSEKYQEKEMEQGPGTTVFVKNLNFSTTEEALRLRFASKYKVRSAVISRKLDISNPSLSLSMGFGFIQFYHAKDAQDAIKTMQGILLDGHCLELKISNREDSETEPRRKKHASELEQGYRTKIHVKNIPFQANREEVKNLFATFGELRGFRLPKKAGGTTESHRGFGFVDYLTQADARRAFNALSHSTHFYGKRLVLEWAKADESIENLREKARNSSSLTSKEPVKRKRKLKEIERDLSTIDDD